MGVILSVFSVKVEYIVGLFCKASEKQSTWREVGQKVCCDESALLSSADLLTFMTQF